MIGAAALMALVGACTPEGAATPIGGDAATVATTAVGTPSTQVATSTLAPPPEVVPRFAPGPLAPGLHRTSVFVFPLTMVLPQGDWSTEGDTETELHVLQAEPPDFGGSLFYDWPGIVLLAFPDRDEVTVAADLDGLEELGTLTSERLTIDGREAIRVDARSDGNPTFAPFAAEDGTPFAGLGGHWFADPDVEAVRYRIYLIDMGEGALIAWYSAPEDRFDALVDAASAAIESIDFVE